VPPQGAAVDPQRHVDDDAVHEHHFLELAGWLVMTF